MANLPCTNPCVSCPPSAGSDGRVPIFPDPNDPFNPFVNISSEAPDQAVHIATNGNNPGGGGPPLGSQWTVQGCLTTCVSTVSQQDAQDCAQRQSVQCLSGGWPTTGDNPNSNNPPPPGFPTPPPTVTSPRPVFSNKAQSCDFICPDGSPFTYTVPAGTFNDFTQAGADALAHTNACTLATSNRMCVGSFSGDSCTGVPFSSDCLLSFGSPIVSANVVAGTSPPGLSLSLISTGVRLSGIPTTVGVYSFTMRVTAQGGHFVDKSFTISVASITTNATLPNGLRSNYYTTTLAGAGSTGAAVWSVSSGSLPPGLSLNATTGQITGIPTTGGTYSFTISVP